MEGSRIYDFVIPDITGQPQPLSKFKGKVLLLVNVASRCGYTPQYAGLQRLYEKYQARGFEILGFPCNDFGGQEPGGEAEIKEFCQIRYGVRFPLFSKIHIKGAQAHPLYRFLTTETAFPGEIGWNFTKFLCDRRGRVAARFPSAARPEQLEAEVDRLLAE